MATLSPRRVFFLRMLGTLSIEGGADAKQRSRRSAALLALIAAGGPAGVDRDRVLAFFWPNSDAERAANSFRQILHGIRRDLGDETLIYEGGRLRLNPSRFSVDLWDLERSIRDGQLELADALYRGPLLDGFAVGGLDEFDRWVDAERQRIHQTVINVARQLAQRAAANGRLLDAVAHWRRVTSLDPLSTTGALGLVNALAAAGDRAGALAYARVYQELVRSQLEMEPDDQIEHLVESLRAGGTPPGSARAAMPAAPGLRAPETPAARESWVTTGSHAVRRGATGLLRPWTRLSAAAKIGIATGFALVLLGSVRLYGRSARAVRWMPNVVAVMPLTPLAGVDTSLSRALTELLATDVNGAGPLRAVTSSSVRDAFRATVGDARRTPDLDALRGVAGRFGAGLLITGEIGAAGDETRVTLALRDGHDGSVIGSPVTVDGDAANILHIADEAAARVVAQRYQAPADHLAFAAAFSTNSIVALKAYLRGESAFAVRQYVDAANEFKQATLTDSTFAIAYYRLAVAADRNDRPEVAQRASDLAIHFADRLDDREQRLLYAYAAKRNGRAAESERAYWDIVSDYPEDCEAWFQLGETLFHGNPLHGESATQARPAFERLLELSPNDVEGTVHLARIAVLQGRQRDADSLEGRVVRLIGDARAGNRALRALALRAMIHADDADSVASIGRAMMRQSISPRDKALGLRLLANVSLARGQWADAKAQIDTAIALDDGSSLTQLAIAATQRFIAVSVPELEDIRSRVMHSSPERDTASANAVAGALERLHALGLLDVRLSDKNGARAAAASLDSFSGTAGTRRVAHTLAQSIRAHLAASEGHPLEALAKLDSAGWEGPAHRFPSEVADRYLRATLLMDVGRTSEAARWFGAIAERSAYELPYLAPSQAALATLDEKAGNAASARQHRRRVEALWGRK